MFKVGDKVKCIDEGASDGHLELGSIYEVISVTSNWVSVPTRSGGILGWVPERFELYTEPGRDPIKDIEALVEVKRKADLDRQNAVMQINAADESIKELIKDVLEQKKCWYADLPVWTRTGLTNNSNKTLAEIVNDYSDSQGKIICVI